MIRAIFLDLDGTLVPRGALWLRCVERFLEDRRGTGEPVPVGSFMGLIPEVVARPDLDRRDLARAVAEMYPGLGLTASQVAADFDVRLPLCVEPDRAVVRMLADLSGRFRTAVVTNGSSRMQRAKLGRAGLTRATGRVFISGEVGVRKPDAGIFRRALDWAGVAPEEALMVGDDRYEDIFGASRAGLRTCLVGGPPCDSPAPDFHVPRVTDLPGVLS